MPIMPFLGNLGAGVGAYAQGVQANEDRLLRMQLLGEQLRQARANELRRQQEQAALPLAFGALKSADLFGGGGFQPAAPIGQIGQTGQMVAGGAMPGIPAGSAVTPTQLNLARSLMGGGYPAAASAGIVGGLTGESGRNLNPAAVGDSGRSIGMAQWQGPRREALMQEPDWQTSDAQTRFLQSEMAPGGPEAKTGEALRSFTGTPQQAADLFTTGNLRPGQPNLGPREQAAADIYQALGGAQTQQAAQPIVGQIASALPPGASGFASLRALATKIDQTAPPGTSDETKMMALIQLQKLLAPTERTDLQTQLAQFRAQNQFDLERERETSRRDLEKMREDFRASQPSKAGGGLEVSKMFDVVDDKGKVVRTVMARERRDQPGFVESEAGKPVELKPGEHLRQITPTTSGGGRAGAQVLRQQIGGREVLSDLQNVAQLPVGSTTGVLGQYEPGKSLYGALHGDLARTLTGQDAQLMQASLASMTRELSILMSPVYGGNYAAQQIEPLVPKTGDTLGTVMFKIARIAQSADNALEAMEKAPVTSNEQKEYAQDLRQQINKAIPWSPQQAMQFAQAGDERQSFGDFVRGGGLEPGGGGAGAAAGAEAPEITKEQYSKLPSGSAYRVPGNPKVMYKQ